MMSLARIAPIVALCSLMAFPARADEPAKNVAEIQAAADRALIRDLLDYLARNPKAVDIDQAYMKVFDKAIEHDWFADNEPVAKAYLANYPDGPVRALAQIVTTMARAQAGKYIEALASYDALMAGLEGPEQEEFASNFADSLAQSATIAGEPAVARQAYETLLKKYGQDSPNLAQKVRDELAHLDLVGKPAPEVKARDIADAPFRLADAKGKYVLVDFWATWCAPCIAELPRLQAAQAKYKDKGLVIVGVSLDESKAAVADFVKARQVDWRQIHNATSDGDLVEAFSVKTIPATFLIDPKGTIVRLDLRGPALDKALEELIK
ncbi:redoxin domain-containing protein [Tundrisphaera sp. TA3]|uniref:redoxin domain-containing protein n=1 Tax=Tundrisphaera sp. TA3 TaxID=3435775 RepID=UPI003EBCA76A